MKLRVQRKYEMKKSETKGSNMCVYKYECTYKEPTPMSVHIPYHQVADFSGPGHGNHGCCVTPNQLRWFPLEVPPRPGGGAEGRV